MRVNESGNMRGLHIAVVNQLDGKVVSAEVFDTYKTSLALDRFIDQGIPEGCIVVATCRDDCTKALSDKAKTWLMGLGSKEISNVGYRQGFAFIGRNSNQPSELGAVNEKRANSSKDQVQVTQLFS